MLNDTFLADPAYGYSSPVCRRHVLCQEVGHTLGLGHQTGVSCMNDGECASLHPNQEDYSTLNQVYGHRDKVSTVAGPRCAEGKTAAADGERIPLFALPFSFAELGTPVEHYRHSTVYRRAFPDGSSHVSWVRWAD